MNKKLVSLLLAASMVFSICACGNSEENKTVSSETKQNVAESSETQQVVSDAVENVSLYPLVDNPITVKGVVIGTPSPNGRVDKIVWNKVSEITGVNIEWEVVSPEAISTYLASNNWPDFFHGNLSETLIYDFGVLGDRFVNYLEYLDVMPNFAKALEDYPMMKKGTTLSNGEMYATFHIDKSATATAVRPYVRTDVLEAAGVKMPTTVDEFAQALRDLKAYYGEVSFIPKLNNYNCTWAPMLYAAFGTGCNPIWDVDESGVVYFAGMTEQMKHYYEYMNGLYEEGLIHQELATLDATTIKALEKSGKVAFLDYAANDIPADENGVWHLTCVAPLTSEYDSTQEVMGAAAGRNMNSIFINNKSDYVKEICQMVDIAYATEEVVEGSGLLGQSFLYGFEGEHWKRNDDGKTYSFFIPEGYDSFNQFQGAELIWMNIGRADALEGYVTDTPSNNQARQIGFVESVFPYMEKEPFEQGLLVFTEEQQDVIDNHWTEIDTYVKQMQVEFITGVTDIATGWDVYCNTLEKMGINDVVTVYQEAYDKLMAN